MWCHFFFFANALQKYVLMKILGVSSTLTKLALNSLTERQPATFFCTPVSTYDLHFQLS